MQMFLPVFEALNQGGVRYLVAGGFATVLHGYQRLTGDIDLILDLELENCRKAVEILQALKFKPRAPVSILDFADPLKRSSWVHEKSLKVFSLFASTGIPFDIDLFVQEPMPFNELATRAEQVPVASTSVPILSIPDLIELKRLANRPQDLEDIKALEIILSEKAR